MVALIQQVLNNVGSGAGEGDADNMGCLMRYVVELLRYDKVDDKEIRGSWGKGRTRS